MYNKFLEYTLKNDPNKVISSRGLRIRKFIHPFLRKLSPLFAKSNLNIEDREKMFERILNNLNTLQDELINEIGYSPITKDQQIRYKSILEDIETYEMSKEKEQIMLGKIKSNNPAENNKTKRAIIYASTHGFKDDISLNINAIDQHALTVFASIPVYLRSFEGISLWVKGVLAFDRKDKESRKSVIPKIEYAIDLGADGEMYVEGVWNKTPNLLVLKLFKGIYKVCVKKNAIIVPIGNLQVEKESYVIIGKPFDITKYSEEEGMAKLRDILATLRYELMVRHNVDLRENYGTIEEAKAYWQSVIDARIAETKGLYDYEIEDNAQYIDKNEPTWEEVMPITTIEHGKVYDTYYSTEESLTEEIEQDAKGKQYVLRPGAEGYLKR